MVNLSKGQKLSLDKSLQLAIVGLGWDPNKYTGSQTFDLDAVAFLLDASGRVTTDEDLVFYGNPVHPSGCAKALGDDRTGNSSDGGDDEQIIINFSRVPAYVQKIVVAVSIYDAAAKRQNFGQVSNAYVRVAKIKSESDTEGDEVVRFELDEEFSDEAAVIACEITRNGSEWKFGAVGMGYNCELDGLCRMFGIDL